MKKIYLVVGTQNCPGRVFAVFVNEEDALAHRDFYLEDEGDVEERSLLLGPQPFSYMV